MHSVILGATRSGKTRCILLQSICFTGLSGESMIISDPKGELHDYTAPYLERLNYEVITLDFKTPPKSNKYNFLQPVIDMIADGKTDKAASMVRDLTEALVPETKGEPIWRNGQMSIISGAIMSVVFDNMEKYEYQNLTNVYNFIAKMGKPDKKGRVPLNQYMEDLDDDHPAKVLYDVSVIAPSKTRGSFFTSALSTLQLFTDPYIYSMTSETEFDLKETGHKKRAIFIILPDEKKTYHGLATIFVGQQYTSLVDVSDKLGGRLSRRVNFILEEIGNFAKMELSNYLTVGAGRGCRFNLVLQSFAQLEETYGEKITQTVKDNCHCLIYLRSENPGTNKEISDRLGPYTTASNSESSSTSKGGGGTASTNLIGRPLLLPTEVNKIRRPYLLVMLSGEDPAMMKMPDISLWLFNIMLGMGNKPHNTALRMFRQNRRMDTVRKTLELWDIWKSYISHDESKVPPEMEYSEDFGEGFAGSEPPTDETIAAMNADIEAKKAFIKRLESITKQ